MQLITKIMKTKKLKLFTISLLQLCLVVLGAGCNGEDVKDTTEINPCPKTYESIKSLKNVIGIIGFDKINKEFIINIHKEGTIDEIITAYPCELSNEFKKIGLEVILDGYLFVDEDLPKPTFGGQEMFRIDITTISITN